MWSRINNQDVGLAAALIYRVRNSSLFERFCADNLTGLKHVTEAVDLYPLRRVHLVEERSVLG